MDPRERERTGEERGRRSQRGRGGPFARIIRVALLLGSACASPPLAAQPGCSSCEVQIGIGGTYHFWATTGGVVLPVSVTWGERRYELGIFRMTTQQLLLDRALQNPRVAQPYWGVSLSRRWRFIERGPLAAFVGFGLAGRTESDTLSATRWDFASQLGVRWRLPGNRASAELTMRHWSNAGIRLPNHGQDFATFTVRVGAGPFG